MDPFSTARFMRSSPNAGSCVTSRPRIYIGPSARIAYHAGKGSGVELIFSISPGTALAWGSGFPCAPIPATPSRRRRRDRWASLNGTAPAACYMVIDRKQETFFVLLEQTPSERQRIQRTLKLLVYEAMAN
jgi:hypothetical protein